MLYISLKKNVRIYVVSCGLVSVTSNLGEIAGEKNALNKKSW